MDDETITTSDTIVRQAIAEGSLPMRTLIATLLVASIGLSVAGSADAIPIAYDEAVSGDLGELIDPSVGTIDIGDNTVSGTHFYLIEEGSLDFDSFRFTVPTGVQVTTISLSWVLFPQQGNTFAVAGYRFQDLPFGTFLEPFAIDYHNAASPLSGFSAVLPVGPGTYRVLSWFVGTITCCGWVADYTWTITATAGEQSVPEPTTLLLLGTGLLGVVPRRRRRS